MADRVFRANKASKSALYLGDTEAILMGDSRHFVVADERGITLKGPISIVADAMGCRTGALFVGLNDFLNMIPSCIVAPIPKQIPFPPVFGIAGIVACVATCKSLLV